MPNPLDASPIGELLVSDVVGSLGDLASKTLERLTGTTLSSDEPTSLVRRATLAWKTPLGALTCEQVRLLISQDMGTAWIAPVGCMIVKRLPDAMVTFYPGDLAGTILRQFPAVFAADPDGARELLAADFNWIDRLRQTDEEFGTTSALEAEQQLEAARAMAS
jgi:hypothetical protein